MRLVFLAIVLATTPLLAQSKFDLQGYVAARSMNASGPESWLAGDVGRLEQGGEHSDFSGVAQFGFDWTPSRYFDVHASGAARRDHESNGGVVEAYADARAIFTNDEIQLRAGQFFLPSSRENKDDLWTSPYAISFSALNTWIAEEVRPVGVDVEWRHTFGSGHTLTTAATGFRGNDSMGALLGWRGWSIGNRLTTYSEVLPLPPLASFHTFFSDQREDGTKPFGSDLDGATGISARVRYSIPQRANVQYLYADNRADRRLYRGEYAWATNFHLISAEAGSRDNIIVAAEYMTGSTGMGFAPAFVQLDFYATYVLISEKIGRTRWTARYELFGTQEQDFSLAEGNDESGRSWTLAWLYQLTPSLRLGTELTQIRGHRASVAMDAHSYTVEARYSF